ncbi:MAG TPA: ATP-binding protein [Phycisphaerales bacterium]|nr:ATP-binding protein [Phycisphaerales bacterium]HMP36252.1 ATP-binding protein [Phycisphaerales bacterium]
MSAGLSLSAKSQMLLGAAIVALVTGALAVPWIRIDDAIDESQHEVARQLADVWKLRGEALRPIEWRDAPIRMRFVPLEPQIDAFVAVDDFQRDTIEQFRAEPERRERFLEVRRGNDRLYRYARAIRQSERTTVQARGAIEFRPGTRDASVADPLQGVLFIDRDSSVAAGQTLISRVFLVATGVGAALIGVLLVHLILARLVLRPVRALGAIADRVRRGDLSARAKIGTGDEFERLAESINEMLERVERTQERLRTINASLDLKVGQLAEANLGLDESNRLKSEFVANVSHELRTPLNSIIGFAELLEELARGDPQADPKRMRYISNILNSGRALLDMIEDLLNMARLESGRMEVNVEPTSIADLVEGLQGIMRPQAQRKGIEIETRLVGDLPLVETDPGKLQQILYNFVSNAIKFSPAEAPVLIAAERVMRDDTGPGVRISVVDRGPGIPYDQQETIFRRFRQLEAAHTRGHGGTGLGLAICRELGDLLGASVSVVSEPGRGATFSVEIPVAHRSKQLQALME